MNAEKEKPGNQDHPQRESVLSMVVFSADWSGACRMMQPAVREVCRLFEHNLHCSVLDADDMLAKEFRIRELPSVLFFRNGELLEQVRGLVSRKHLHEIVLRLLNPASDAL